MLEAAVEVKGAPLETTQDPSTGLARLLCCGAGFDMTIRTRACHDAHDARAKTCAPAQAVLDSLVRGLGEGGARLFVVVRPRHSSQARP